MWRASVEAHEDMDVAVVLDLKNGEIRTIAWTGDERVLIRGGASSSHGLLLGFLASQALEEGAVRTKPVSGVRLGFRELLGRLEA